MAAPTVTDAEFMALFKQLGSSPSKLASYLGISERNVYARRRRLEARYDLPINSDRFYKHTPSAEQAPRKHAEIANGTVLVFSDAHFWPGVRTTAFRGLLLFIRELKPSLIVCNGDAFDGASISRFPRIGWDSKPAVNEEMKACQERLGEIEEIANGAGLYWPLGNHDSRYETMLAQNAPQYEGVAGFTLKDHFPAWTPCWSLWLNSRVVIKHRWKSGVHAGHNNTMGSGVTMVTGHDHNLGVTPWDDYTGTRWGVRTGTLADPNGPQFVDYTEDNPKNWRSGFAVLTFNDGDLLWPEVARVKAEGKIDFRGMVLEV